MTRSKALDRLEESLTTTINEWIENNSDGPALEALNMYFGNGTAEAMARAAIAVLDGIADAHAYLRKEVGAQV